MSTYENCYELLSQLRYDLDEHSTALVQGTDTSGAFHNDYLVKKLCQSVRRLHAMLQQRIPELFLESVDLTASSSVLTLPWNFGRLKQLRDENGNTCWPIDISMIHKEAADGSSRLYYRKGNTLVIDKDGLSDTYTLKYYTKPRQITTGMSSAGGALWLTLATSAKAIADYYNGMTIENVTDDWVDTISDYTAARVATLAAQTGAASKYYGIVPEIPEHFHELIAPYAAFLVKGSHPAAKQKPTQTEQSELYQQLSDLLASYGVPGADIDIEEIFEDFQPQIPDAGGVYWGES